MREPVGAGDRTSITSAVRSMRAARGRARQFWRVFDTSLVPMVMVDNERRYLAANAAGRLLFRLSLDELLARRIDDLTPAHGLPTLLDRWRALMRDGQATGTYDVGFPDGSELKIVYRALANLLPGQHLIVFAPAEWPGDELATDAAEGSPPRGALSPREREVLTLVATGADAQRVADELTISVATVRTHARNALQKLGARNRAHAIALAMQHGLIDLTPHGAAD